LTVKHFRSKTGEQVSEFVQPHGVDTVTRLVWYPTTAIVNGQSFREQCQAVNFGAMEPSLKNSVRTDIWSPNPKKSRLTLSVEFGFVQVTRNHLHGCGRMDRCRMPVRQMTWTSRWEMFSYHAEFMEAGVQQTHSDITSIFYRQPPDCHSADVNGRVLMWNLTSWTMLQEHPGPYQFNWYYGLLRKISSNSFFVRNHEISRIVAAM
jgi:hypothetical protein